MKKGFGWLLLGVGLYFAADVAYIVKSAANVNLIPSTPDHPTAHHGPWFLLSDDAVTYAPDGPHLHPGPAAAVVLIAVGLWAAAIALLRRPKTL